MGTDTRNLVRRIVQIAAVQLVGSLAGYAILRWLTGHRKTYITLRPREDLEQ